MKREVAQRILKENRDSYDKMANEFSGTRERFWSELSFLAEHAVPGMRVLDIGCGNGRFYPLLAERKVDYVGLDSSLGLLDEARKKYPEVTFQEGDATNLPFPDKSFDIAFSFAVIHHIPGGALQKKFIEEVSRVLKPGKTFILTSWYLWTPQYERKIFANATKRVFGLSQLEVGDVMLTFGKDKHKRYLHAFTVSELTKLLTKNGFEVVGSEITAREVSGKDSKKPPQQNILVVARKK